MKLWYPESDYKYINCFKFKDPASHNVSSLATPYSGRAVRTVRYFNIIIVIIIVMMILVLTCLKLWEGVYEYIKHYSDLPIS